MIRSISQSIKFIHKDNASLFTTLGCSKKLSHSFCPHSNKHLLKLRGHHLQKLASSLISECPRQHSLSSSRRSIKQNSSSNPRPHFFVRFWMFQKIYGLSELLLNIFSSIIILEIGIVASRNTQIQGRGCFGMHLMSKILHR